MRPVVLTLPLMAIFALAVPASAGTVGYWRFEEGAADAAASGAGSVLDSSGLGNHGTPTNGPIYRADVALTPVPLTGQANTRSLDFGGVTSGQRVNAGSAASLDDLGVFTVEAWIKPEGFGEGNSGRIVQKGSGDGNANGFNFLIVGSAGGFLNQLMFMQSFTGGSNVVSQWVTGANSISLNTWQHVAVIYDRSTPHVDPRMFIDGVEQSVTETIDAVSGTVTSDKENNLIIGARATGTGSTFDRFFDGRIDEVRISNTALTVEQMLLSSGVPEPGALACLGLAAAGVTLSRLRRRSA